MSSRNKLKIAMIGAGSTSFCPATLSDILLSERFKERDLEVTLMDINDEALQISHRFAKQANAESGRSININCTVELDEALKNADFVITAIELDRYHYWSMDFHIPRRYGFRQIYGENGGPGGMFHTLRNLPPIIHIAKRMEALCPDAWLINYSNPEAKLVEAVSKLTSIKVVGVCHGFEMGVDQIAMLLERPADSIEVKGHGLNHFGFMTSIRCRETGEDLYPLLKEKEAAGNWLADWDELALSRIMLRTYGLWPYPGANHIGEYIAWSDGFLASAQLQYFFDPAREKPWETKKPPEFVYSFTHNPTAVPFHPENDGRVSAMENAFSLKDGKLTGSHEYGIPIIEGIVFDLKRHIPSLNMIHNGTMPGIMNGMCTEGPCRIDKEGIHPVPVECELPAAINAMINHQGAIHRLIIEAYAEKSRKSLLQAIMLDPTVSSYNNAVALIDEMFERQKEILPPMSW